MKGMKGFWSFVIIVSVLAFLVSAASAVDIKKPSKLPIITDPEKRWMVGGGGYLGSDGTPVEVGEVGPFVVYELVGPKEVTDETTGNFRAGIIELRLFVPDKMPHEMPLLALLWDEDYDGFADYVAIATGPGENNKGTEFTVFGYPEPAKGPAMSDGFEFFSNFLKKMMEQMLGGGEEDEEEEEVPLPPMQNM